MTAVSPLHSTREARLFRTALTILTIALTGPLAGCGHDHSSSTAQTQADPGAGKQVETAQSAQSPASTISAAQGSDAPSAAQSGPAGDPQPTLLSNDDIKFYLDVMGAAADRVHHPTPQDLDALGKQKAFLDAASTSAQTNTTQEQAISDDTAKAQAAIAAAIQSGDMAKAKALAAAESAHMQAQAKTLQPAAMPDAATMSLAMNLGDGQADRQVVAERHLDSQRYERVAGAIEEILVPPGTPMADCGGDCGFGPSAADLQRKKAFDEATARNRKLLMPYADQIGPLQQIVRNGKQ